MKIVIATAVYYPQINGVAVFSHNLAQGLAARGHEVLVICPSQKGHSYTELQDGVKVCYLRSIEAKVYPDQIHPVPAHRHLGRFKLPKLWYRHGFRVSVFPQPEVNRILGSFQPDVVHVQVSDPIGLSVVGWARRHHIPVVTTEHNQPEVLTDPLKLPSILKQPANFLLASYFRSRQAKSDFVTMPTEQSIRNLLKNRDIGVPIAAVSNGVDLQHFRPGQPPAQIYEKYHIPKGRPIVLYLGRVDPEKQVGRVIEAFTKARATLINTGKPHANQARSKLPPTGASPLLLIVGDGVDRARLERQYAGDADIMFLGKVLPPDLYHIYQLGDVFATASEIETQGIVLIEAAACGLPLIAVDKGAVSEICQDGVNGILCPAGNVPAITDALVKLLTDGKLRQQYSRASIKLAAQHDLGRTLDRFEHIYQHVIAKHS